MERRWFSVAEIAEYLGVSPNTIRKWIRTGKIPFCRLNGAIRFDINEIEQWTAKKKKLIYV